MYGALRCEDWGYDIDGRFAWTYCKIVDGERLIAVLRPPVEHRTRWRVDYNDVRDSGLAQDADVLAIVAGRAGTQERPMFFSRGDWAWSDTNTAIPRPAPTTA